VRGDNKITTMKTAHMNAWAVVLFNISDKKSSFTGGKQHEGKILFDFSNASSIPNEFLLGAPS
jgi:hypothetical protein